MKKIWLTIIDLVFKVWPAGNSPIATGTVSSLMAAIIGYLININFGSDITLLVGVIFWICRFEFFKSLYKEQIK